MLLIDYHKSAAFCLLQLFQLFLQEAKYSICEKWLG